MPYSITNPSVFRPFHRFPISQRFIAGRLLLKWLRSRETNLARVDLGAGESVVVCTHLDCILSVPRVMDCAEYRNDFAITVKILRQVTNYRCVPQISRNSSGLGTNFPLRCFCSRLSTFSSFLLPTIVRFNKHAYILHHANEDDSSIESFL